MDVEGAHGMLGLDQAPPDGFAQSTFLAVVGPHRGEPTRCSATIGERVLGLPRGPPGQGRAFRELARS